jgi:hypothetical protein
MVSGLSVGLVPLLAPQSVKEKQDIVSGHFSDDPVGQGKAQSASSFVVPQKNDDEMPVPGVGVGAVVTLLQDVNGIQDSPEGQLFEDPVGHGSKHLLLASSRSTPQ